MSPMIIAGVTMTRTALDPRRRRGSLIGTGPISSSCQLAAARLRASEFESGRCHIVTAAREPGQPRPSLTPGRAVGSDWD